MISNVTINYSFVRGNDGIPFNDSLYINHKKDDFPKYVFLSYLPNSMNWCYWIISVIKYDNLTLDALFMQCLTADHFLFKNNSVKVGKGLEEVRLEMFMNCVSSRVHSAICKSANPMMMTRDALLFWFASPICLCLQ